MKAERAEAISKQGLLFLRLYAELARICHTRRKKRFPLVPKGHYLHHQFLQLLQQSQKADCTWCFNFLSYAVQQEEDYIGKPSRLARRVSSRSTSLRVIQRAMLAVRGALGAEADDS